MVYAPDGSYSSFATKIFFFHTHVMESKLNVSEQAAIRMLWKITRKHQNLTH